MTFAVDAEASRASIERLLAAGEYVEGEALVVVRKGASPSVPGQIETLAEVDDAAVELAAHDVTGSAAPVERLIRQRVQDVDADAYAVEVVVDHNRSTQDILTDLYNDSNVVAAQPNYLNTVADPVDDPLLLDEPVDDVIIEEIPTAEAPAESQAAPEQTAPEQTQSAPAQETTEPQEQQVDLSAFPAPNPIDMVPVTINYLANESVMAANYAALATPYGTNNGNLTTLQWQLADKAGMYTTPEAPHGVYNMNVPGWNGKEANASGTVAIMDTGIDADHPDLKGSLFEFTNEQQASFGCGPHGINVSGGTDATDVHDVTGHGTHVAGVVAAQWNGAGVSGVANGVKLFSVRVFANEGSSTPTAAVVKGFAFLGKVARDVNLKAVNCSLGSGQPDFLLAVMSNQLGAQGANTVWASMNNARSLDEDVNSGHSKSPYAITVDAANQDGQKASFSNFGPMSTDVFAAGTAILSTYPDTVATEQSSRRYVNFFPEVTATSNLANGSVERFSETPKVRFFDNCPLAIDGVTAGAAQEIGSLDKTVGFDDKTSWSFDVTAPASSDGALSAAGAGASDDSAHIWMAIPLGSIQRVSWLGARLCVSDGAVSSGGFTKVICAKRNDDGSVSPTALDLSVSEAMSGSRSDTMPKTYGQEAVTRKGLSGSQWAAPSLSLGDLVACANYVHGMGTMLQTASSVSDPGVIAGAYIWQDGGQRYVLAELTIDKVAAEGEGQETVHAYLDNVAVGDEASAIGAYESLSGTSVAAPAVAGSLAVIAKNEPESARLSEQELSDEALQRAAKLLAAVDYDDKLATLCRTGGRVDLKNQTSFDKLAPLITGTSVAEGTLTLDGHFFGTKGTLSVDGVVLPTTTWEDGKVTASVDGLAGGSHLAKVTNADGAVSRTLFVTSGSEDELRLFERNHPVPLDLKTYADDATKTFAGTMVSCDNKLFALSEDGDGHCAALWSYDTETQAWSRCADLPEGLQQASAENSSVAASNGKVCIYAFGEGYSAIEAHLWSYDPKKDAWEESAIKDMQGSGLIFAIGDQLFFVSSEEGAAAGSMYLVDWSAGTLQAVAGTYPHEAGAIDTSIATSGSAVYVLNHLSGSDSKGYGTLTRLTYDKESGAFTSADLSDALNKAVGEDYTGTVTMAGLPDGVMLIGSGLPGQDAHIIKDSESSTSLYGRTSSYHAADAQVAAYLNDYVYVVAVGETKAQPMYLRSSQVSDPGNKEMPAEAIARSKAASQKTTTAVNGGKTTTASKATPSTATKAKTTPVATAGRLLAGTGDFVTHHVMICSMLATLLLGVGLHLRERML